tara:strand:+ start:4145 stop:5788 length:1644 start_codon:yes stop_codon:yes gene_type:complete
MAEKIDVGITVKGVDKGIADLNKLADFAENLGSALSGADKDVGVLEGGLDRMTKGAYSGFKKGADGIKTFIIGLKATKTAIVATGIGALVVAFGLLVVYWDDIKEAVTGVNEEQKLLLKYAEGTRDAAQDQLTLTQQSESTLLLAGKSERDILNLKTQQTNEVILATEQILLQQKQQKEAQVKAAERNQKITAGILAFLTLPLSVLFGAVDALTFGLAKLGVLEEGTSMVEDAAMWTASFIFDPEKVEEEGEATIEAIEDELLKMKNTRDGFILQQQDADAAADKAAADARDKAATDAAASEQEAIDTAKANAAALKKAIQSDAQNEIDVVKAKYIALNELAKGNAEAKAILKDKEDAALLAITKKYAKKEVEVVDTEAAKRIAIEKATADAVRTARLGIVAAGFDALKSMAKTEEGQKRLAISQILVNQGIAMSEAFKAAQVAAAATGPAAPVMSPLFTAQMIGMVLSSFASIKGVMNQAGASSGPIGTSSGGGGGGGSTQLALTPTLDSFGEGTLELPAVQAYVLQNNIADADALQQALQNQSSL